MTNRPFLKDVEHESLIGKYRIAAGMSVNELAEMCGTTHHSITKLQNGMMPPYYIQKRKRGEIRPVVERILKVLGERLQIPIGIGELFPRYICDIQRFGYEGEITYAPEQLEKLCVVDGLEQKIIIADLIDKKITPLFQQLNPRYVKAFKGRLEGKTYQEIGDEFGVTREMARQMVGKVRGFLKEKISKDEELQDFVMSGKGYRKKNIWEEI